MFWFFSLVLATVASSARAERLPPQAYTTAEGLPHNEIKKIVRDSRGFLWFCTGDGLARFDGYSFTNYGTAEGLPHGRVTDFVETLARHYQDVERRTIIKVKVRQNAKTTRSVGARRQRSRGLDCGSRVSKCRE